MRQYNDRWLPFWVRGGVVFFLAILVGRGHAQESDGPAVRERVAKTLARVLSYDESMVEKAGSTLVLGIVAKAGVASSVRDGEEWLQVFAKLEAYRIRGLPFHAELVRFQSADAFEKAIRERHLYAVLVCPGMEGDVAQVRALAKKHQVLTVASSEELLAPGLSVGVWYGGGRVNLVVNYPVAQEVGARFGSDLLRLAKILH